MLGEIGDIDLSRFATAAELFDELRRSRAEAVVVHDGTVTIDDHGLAALVDALRAPMAATASPVPLPGAGSAAVLETALDTELPPAPSLPTACPRLAVISVDAVASIGLSTPGPGTDGRVGFASLCDALTSGGWRHVAAPGAVLDWDPSEVSGDVWPDGVAAEVSGPANDGLETHRLWARTRLRPMSVLIDGACVTDSIHNGSQAVVLNVAQALRRVRPDAEVGLAVPKEHVASTARVLAGTGVTVTERGRLDRRFDVVYRPYQLLDPGEVDWLVAAGERLVVAQLDMIAFSNPTYHVPAHFHAVRNLQRWTMRHADGVTFISDFGRATAIGECPDLDPRRLFVVSCGADPTPPPGASPAPTVEGLVGGRFIACVSATFRHKNRQHAIGVFGELYRRGAYDGRLVVAGPEPYYGRSTEVDDEAIAALDPATRERIVRLGQVDEGTKWWLLRSADLVLYPSIIEGFGLIPFEAASVGTPSLSHRGSAIAEVLDPAATVVGWDRVGWADAAAAILDDPNERERVLTGVRNAAERLTWDRSAELAWEAFESTIARPRSSFVVEEGGIRSRTGRRPERLATGVSAIHFGNRVLGYLERRFGS